LKAAPIDKRNVTGILALIVFGCWLLSTVILFLINYRAYLPSDINRLIHSGIMLHIAGFFIGSALAWFSVARGNVFKTLLVFMGLFALGAVLETCQILVTYRQFDFVDVIGNGLGIGLFFLILNITKPLCQQKR